jgi:glycosyltransferase involved in cell wall biosynthesis
MRVALDVRPALTRPTGVGVYIGALAAALPAHDRDSRFTLFTSSLRERWARPAVAENVRLVDRQIPVRALNFAWNRLSWPPIELLCGGKFDLVHSPHALLIPTRRARRIITIHDLFFFKRPELTGAEIRRDYAPLVQAHAARADGILCPSEYTAGEIERLLRVPREKICVTTYGVDPAFRQGPGPGEGEALFDRLGVSGPGILYVGSEEKRKNLGALVAAYRNMFEGTIDAPPLVLVGPGASFDTGKTSSGPRVVSTGYLQTSEINALMRLSKCLVLVSLDEGFGFPVAEAMTVGLPVVCSSGSSLEEIAEGAAELVDDPHDEAAIVRGLARVLDDPRRASELRAKGLARSRLFDWNCTAEATLAFYRKVLGS